VKVNAQLIGFFLESIEIFGIQEVYVNIWLGFH
jgi:hypothetical protein